MVIVFLLLFNIDVEIYNVGGDFINMFLGPATVVLAVPLYNQLDNLKRYAVPIVVGIFIGTIIGVISIIISCVVFDLNEEIFDKTLLKSLADIKIKDFDVVFLCRSDNFFAPHLDPYFDEIVRLIESRFHDIRIEKSVNEVRDYRKYDSMYEKLHRSLKNS